MNIENIENTVNEEFDDVSNVIPLSAHKFKKAQIRVQASVNVIRAFTDAQQQNEQLREKLAKERKATNVRVLKSYRIK